MSASLNYRCVMEVAFALGGICSFICRRCDEIVWFPLSALPLFGCSHVFGVKVNVANALHYAEESTLVYTAGHNVVKYAMDTKVQEFLNGSETAHHISCVSVSSSRR